jgi:hypothetical protein
MPVYSVNTGSATGFCLEIHDLAARKLAAFRERDREFARLLLCDGPVDPNRAIQQQGRSGRR